MFIAADILRNMRAIAATHEAMRRVGGNGGGEFARGYSDGFIDGLRALAESLGLSFQPGAGNSSLGVRWEW